MNSCSYTLALSNYCPSFLWESNGYLSQIAHQKPIVNNSWFLHLIAQSALTPPIYCWEVCLLVWLRLFTSFHKSSCRFGPSLGCSFHALSFHKEELGEVLFCCAGFLLKQHAFFFHWGKLRKFFGLLVCLLVHLYLIFMLMWALRGTLHTFLYSHYYQA